MVTPKPYRTLSAMAGALLIAGCSAPNPPSEASAESAAPIVGGEVDAEHTEVFGLLMAKEGGLASCSSTLIAPNLLLTARHCVSEHVAAPVICGASGLGPANGADTVYAANPIYLDRKARWFRASEVHVPTEGDDTCGYDVALIVLAENVPASVASPAVPRIDREVEVGESYVAVGYGLDDSGDAGERRVRSDLSISCEPGRCGIAVRVSEFIGETGVCEGDSGGPAFDSEGKVVGVVSRGTDNCGTPIYSTVTAWRDLLLSVGARAAELGGYEPPFWVKSGSSDAPPPPPKFAAVGESCSSFPCVEGAACFRSAPDAEPSCAAVCSTDGDCSSGSQCQPVGDGSSSVCLAGPAKPARSGGCALRGRAPLGDAPTWVLGAALGLSVLFRRAVRSSRDA